MKLYAGIDLHSNNNYIAILNETDKAVYQKRLPNDLEVITRELAPYQKELEGIVVESTYNWYWLVDGLQEMNYSVYLANPTAIQIYSGLKYTDDKTDARWLAKLFRLDILSTGYIYPKEERGLRELLRKRLVLVRQQTRCLLGIQGTVVRYENIKLSADKIKQLTKDKDKLLSYVKDKHVQLSVKSEINVLSCLLKEIDELEKAITKEIKINPGFKLLQKIPGIGPILAMTILLETGDIRRFNQAGNYSSYCRCVESKRISNEKKKGKNNRKNGNTYLGWAFIEAANYAIRYNEQIRKYYQYKLNKTKRVIALKTVANKLARATYFILKDGAEFEMKKMLG